MELLTKKLRDPFAAALFVAVLLHAGVVVSGVLVPAAPAPGALAPTARETLFDVAVDTVAVAAPPREAPPMVAKANDSPRASAQAAKAVFVPKGAGLPPGVSDAPPSVEPEVPGDAREGLSPNETGTPSVDDYGAPAGEGGEGEGGPLGLQGRPIYAVIPGLLGGEGGPAPAPTAPPKPAEIAPDVATRALSGSMRAKDAALGIGQPATGTVELAVADIIQGSDAPAEHRATFVIQIGPDGRVTGATVQRSSAGTQAMWDRLAKSLRDKLASQTLPLFGGAATRGAVVTVTVESKVTLPSGAKEKAEVKPVCADDVLRALADPTGELTRLDPKAELPCIPVGLGVAVDLADIAAKRKRIVHTTAKLGVPGEKALIDPKEVDTRAPWLAPDDSLLRRSEVVPKKKKKKKK